MSPFISFISYMSFETQILQEDKHKQILNMKGGTIIRMCHFSLTNKGTSFSIRQMYQVLHCHKIVLVYLGDEFPFCPSGECSLHGALWWFPCRNRQDDAGQSTDKNDSFRMGKLSICFLYLAGRVKQRKVEHAPHFKISFFVNLILSGSDWEFQKGFWYSHSMHFSFISS